MQPFEVIVAPYTLYIAPGPLAYSAFPNLDTTPVAPWTTVGTAGNKSYMNTGITVSQPQTIGTFVGAGSTAIRKAWRQTEEITIAFTLVDLSPAQYALQINNNAVSSTVATGGAPGDQHFEVFRGAGINAFALLLRGVSPINEAYSAQYEVPYAYNAGNAAPVLSNQGPAGLAVEWHAVEAVAGQLATFRAANTP